MLWYLLYPLRGTTEAPVLAPTHPLRTAFSRYGTWAARHVKIVLPISTAVVFVLLYMFPFLYTTDSTNITSGLSNLPHHVWTDAQPLGERVNVEPDVVMRSIWIHGSYMKALKRDVLLGALELQDELLGPTTDFNPRRPEDSPPPSPAPSGDLTREERDAFHIINGLTDQSWFFHSPLQYWSGSSKNIAADDDLVSTVNARKRQPTSVNVTLRHSIVFSGKRFEERKLVAADALVITLIHLRDSPVGRQWIRKAETIAAQSNDKWTIIPADGKSTSHQLYEFQFRPLSWTDWGLLLIAYSLTCFYLMVTLSKLRAVKSRIGLMVTIWAQIAASIFSSFTICAIFKVDLSRIPYFAYPLVVLAISVENSLRLINAVITTSWSESISDRIGEAFGATAHVAVANRVQNLLVLFGLSRITFPGVAAFCTFAAVAVIFDFFYLATFFLSVLSVDVRQRELSELEKVSVRQRRVSQGPNPTLTWFDRIRQWFRLGEVTILTRVAGTIVLLGFVLIAQSHYAPESGRQWLNRIFSLSWRAPAPSTPSSLLIDIHQARSPTSWLRLQDHETAREVINVVKPWAHSYVARVYEPLIFVLKGSDRIPHSREPFFLPAVYDFIHHELPRFVVLLLTVMAMILLFTNYLIRDNRQAGGPNHPDDEPLLSVQTISQGHSLDIVMLAASAGGQLVSAGLDRTIQIRDVLASSRNQLSSESDSSIDELTDLTENLFPVLGMTIDEDSRWLALLSRQSVLLWSIEEQQWTSMMEVDLGGHKPEAFFFGTTQADSIPPLMVVRRNGTMAELDFEVEETKDYVICKTPLVWVVPFVGRYSSRHHTPQLSILTASRKSCIHMVTQHGHQWVSKEINLAARGSKDIHCLVPIPGLSMYLVGRSRTIDLVDLDSSVIIHTFQTEPMQPRSLRQISSTRPRQAGLTSLTLSYVNSETGDLVIHTHVPEEDGNSICPDSPLGAKDGSQRPWSGTREIIWRIANPGTWEALSNGSIVGVRRKSAAQVGHLSPTVLSTGTSGLRRRGGVRPDPKLTAINDTWDVWVINQLETKGSIETTLLEAPGANDSGSLVVSELGPIIKLGTMSVAVGFGNVVKLISVGHEYFDQPRDRLEAEDLRNLTTSRRKRGLASSRARA